MGSIGMDDLWPSLMYTSIVMLIMSLSVVPRLLWWQKYLSDSGVLDNVQQPSYAADFLWFLYCRESTLCSSNSRAACSFFSAAALSASCVCPNRLGTLVWKWLSGPIAEILIQDIQNLPIWGPERGVIARFSRLIWCMPNFDCHSRIMCWFVI